MFIMTRMVTRGLRDFLKKQNVRHVLLVGYATGHVLLPDDRGFQKPIAGLQRVSRRRCHAGNLSREQHAEVCHERSHFLCGIESIDHASVVGENRYKGHREYKQRKGGPLNERSNPESFFGVHRDDWRWAEHRLVRTV